MPARTPAGQGPKDQAWKKYDAPPVIFKMAPEHQVFDELKISTIPAMAVAVARFGTKSRRRRHRRRCCRRTTLKPWRQNVAPSRHRKRQFLATFWWDDDDDNRKKVSRKLFAGKTLFCENLKFYLTFFCVWLAKKYFPISVINKRPSDNIWQQQQQHQQLILADYCLLGKKYLLKV